MDRKNSVIEEAYSIFQQPWWLDTVAPGRWGEVTLKDQNGIFARWPYLIKRKYFLNVLSMPQLTQHLGPWIKPTEAKYCNLISRNQGILTDLVDLLPSYDYLVQNFHISVTDWLPLYWKNFRQTTRYTYILSDIKNHALLWDNFRENIRREIRKAEKTLIVKNDVEIDLFYSVCKKTLERQNKPMSYSLNFLRSIDEACLSRKCRQFFVAQDEKQNIHAAVYIIWDRESAYYLIGGGDPAFRSSGAHSLLMWEAIKYASQHVNQFDFEGSMIQPVERFFRSFNALQVPYFHITHTQKKLKYFKTLI